MIIISCLMILLYTSVNAQSNEEYYIGAVVDYAPTYNKHVSIAINMQNNVKQYESFIKQAKTQEADIIVFPEYGLTTTNVNKDLLSYTTILPDPRNKSVPCETEDLINVIKRVSCAARDNRIYVVVNLLERLIDEQNKHIQIFNTDVVFDRNGALIARYRKVNLFEEPGINVTDTPDLTYFETDFNVTFGIFTCFDILFTEPSLVSLRKNKQITDIVYPTAWFSELPFLTAVQTQAGWARGNGVNLLAAGYCHPKAAKGGSGIYQASGDIIVHIPEKENSSLIVQKIKKIKERYTLESNNGVTLVQVKNYTPNQNLKLSTWNENMTSYNTVLLNKTEENYKLCYENLCCEFTIKITPQNNSDYYYRMVVYSGPRNFASQSNYIQVCGLTACKTTSKETCGERILNPQNPQEFDEIIIKGKFVDEDNSVIFPSNVLYNLAVLNPSDFTYKTKLEDCERSVEIKTTKKVKEILGFGVYSILKEPSKSGSQLSAVVIAIIVIAILIVVAFIGVLIWRRFNNNNYKRTFSG